MSDNWVKDLLHDIELAILAASSGEPQEITVSTEPQKGIAERALQRMAPDAPITVKVAT